MSVIWCANSLAHLEKTKIGKKPTYPKGQRRIGDDLANFLNYSSSLSFDRNDYLCTRCHITTQENFNFVIGCNTSIPMDVDETRRSRTAARAAVSGISTLTQLGLSSSDRDNSSSETSDEENINLDLKINKNKSIELLNNFLGLMDHSPIRDIRNRNAVREKVNDAIVVIRQAAEQVYKDNEKSERLNTDNKPEITIYDVNELIDNFKHLINTSDHSEKIRLLTLTPKAWGQILSSPIDLRGNIPFNPAIEQEIFHFFHSDEINRASSNKKDVLQINKDPKPIKFMLMTVLEAYQLFVQKNPLMRVGKSKFCSLRPKWIKTTTPHDSCACEYHQNPYLLVDVLNRIINSRTDLSSIIKLMICENAQINCYLGDCLNCSTNIPSLFFIEQLKVKGIDEDEDVTWVMWERNDKRTELQRHTTSISTLLDKLDSLWSKFLIHHFITIEQHEFIKKIKLESSEKGTAIIQLDFAENFALFSQTAVQASFWGQKHASIFTVHIKIGSGHRNLVFISDYMKHNTEFVYQAQITIVDFIKKWYPNVKHLNYVSDGAAQHFKNAKNMLNLTYHETDFGLPASWTFSATSHGRGAVDGIGAVVKSRATRFLLSGSAERAFLSPEDFFRYTKDANDHQVMKGNLEPNRPIEAFYIKTSDIDKTF